MLISTHPTFLLINHCKTLPQLHQLHAQAITTGLISLYPSLILTKILYTCCSPPLLLHLPGRSTSHSSPPPLTSLNYALCVFHQIPPPPSTFAFNTIIRAHTLLSSPLSSLLLFARMRSMCVPPDAHTFPFVLKACTHLRALQLGRTLHSQAIKFGFGSDIFVQNTLIHLYCNLNSLADAHHLFDESLHQRDVVSYNAMIHGFVKSRDMKRAREIFDKMPVKDAVSWGTLLTGYAQTNQCEEAIRLFHEMLELGVRPDSVALVSALSACAQIGGLEQGKTIHNYIQRNGIGVNEFLLTGLVDMYAKCGCIETAREIFESNPVDKINLCTWNAMVVGLAMHGHGDLSLEYFLRMGERGVKADGVSFLGVLVGCSHAGLVDEARKLFEEMEGSVYGVRRELKHYGCMADLLGRAGLIKEALEMIEGMPMKGDVFVWGGLLGGCRIHGNVEVAEIAAEHLMEMHSINSHDGHEGGGGGGGGGGVYKIMAEIYANAGRWEDVAKMRRLTNDDRIKFNNNSAAAGCSLLQVDA
ncbi:Pentatricopeptide repeat [Macleaya cordata]|uniref:Pentatricopeptide repeat n=1 Tax=Macleaya cordata TaxID=56857 RepID=A0A200R3S9_MACCD|nr:Pentatricopeptide repeat [Macleaya cordata]